MFYLVNSRWQSGAATQFICLAEETRVREPAGGRIPCPLQLISWLFRKRSKFEKDDAYAVNVTEVAAFSADARVNQELMSTKDAIFHLNFHETG
jgi:hypothetical protein